MLHICCEDDGDEHVLGERVGEVIHIRSEVDGDKHVQVEHGVRCTSSARSW